MKLGFTIFLVAGLIAQIYFSQSSFFMNKGIDLKSLVACSDCGKKHH